MQDPLRIDGHKLMLHPERVAAWMRGEPIAPLYVEVSLSGACNHRCTFCALDFMGYRPEMLDSIMLRERLSGMKASGVRAVMFGGEGEPTLHHDLRSIVSHCAAIGLDCAITTNGSQLEGDLARYCKWIKVSVNAGNPESYGNIHGIKPDHFDRMVSRLKSILAFKAENRLPCTIGVQAVWLPREKQDIAALVKIAREIGADYFVLKPYSRHPRSGKHVEAGTDIGRLAALSKRLRKHGTDRFKVIIRQSAFARAGVSRSYSICRALPFWAYVSANGDVWGCSAHIGEAEFRYGNLYNSAFHEIFNPPREYPADECRQNCRMEPCNEYLDELANPGEHVNFI